MMECELGDLIEGLFGGGSGGRRVECGAGDDNGGPKLTQVYLGNTHFFFLHTYCSFDLYFHALFACIEDLLASLNIKDLVLSTSDKAESLWKTRFGFEKLDQEKLDEYKKSYQLMIFEGTSVLHKSISKPS